jgi:hypothetical protein
MSSEELESLVVARGVSESSPPVHVLQSPLALAVLRVRFRAGDGFFLRNKGTKRKTSISHSVSNASEVGTGKHVSIGAKD